jgi:hypothetical protein
MLLNDSRTIRKEPPKVRARLPILTVIRKVTINVTTVAPRKNGGRSLDERPLLSIERRRVLSISRPLAIPRII